MIFLKTKIHINLLLTGPNNELGFFFFLGGGGGKTGQGLDRVMYSVSWLTLAKSEDCTGSSRMGLVLILGKVEDCIGSNKVDNFGDNFLLLITFEDICILEVRPIMEPRGDIPKLLYNKSSFRR